MDAFDIFLDSESPLVPEDAVAAILLVDERGYALQHRDDKPEIFFPGHWGCFGGAIDTGESAIEALLREMDEELALMLAPDQVSYFTNFEFDFAFAGHTALKRTYFEIRITEQAYQSLRLGEGQGLDCLTLPNAFGKERVVPYDAYALWMHYSHTRLQKRE